MIHFKSNLVFKGIEKALYFSLIFLGIYYIYMGNVLKRFRAKKTNFAEYSESITELPTMLAWIEYSENSTGLEIGVDVNITWNYYSLELGQTVLYNGLKLELEDLERIDISDPSMYRISPLNFPTGMPKDFRYWFSFTFSQNDSTVSKAGISFTTKNNSYCGRPWWDDLFYDGQAIEISAQKESTKWLRLSPVKYLYTKTHEDCRDQPYYDQLFTKTLQLTKGNCTKSCRPPDYILCNSEHKKVFKCTNEAESKCFYEQKRIAAKDMIEKPCTKIEYETNQWSESKTDNQSIEFWVEFSNPLKVTVKEEYLLFDMVAMVSSIGGTMGLCIGFSLADVTKWIMGKLENSFNRVRFRILKSGKRSQLNVELGLRSHMS